MLWEQTVEYAALTDLGFRRQNNEDSNTILIASDAETFQERGHLFAVADGMGGHAVGELASKIAVDTMPLAYYKLRQYPPAEALAKAIQEANTAIHQRGEQNMDFRRMGTTCTSLLLTPEGALAGHVGDSRLYRVRGQRIDQLTFDHSYVWELMRQGKHKLEDILLQHPRNVITRCLGPEAEVEVDLEGPFPVIPGDVFVLCTDGLSGLLRDEEIGLLSRYLPPVEACRLLVDLANVRGGGDNITVIVARIGDLPPGVTPDDAVPRPVQSDQPTLGWVGFGAWSAWGLLTVFAVSLMIIGQVVEGLLFLGLMLILLGPLIITSLRHLKQQIPKYHSGDTTVIWRPYRAARFRLSPDFLSVLANLEQKLERTAIEESWTIDWTEHKRAYTAASNAMNQRKYELALRELGAALHTLMCGAHNERRKGHEFSQRRSGKTPLPMNRPKPEGPAESSSPAAT